MPWGKEVDEKNVSFHLRFIMDNFSMLLELDEAARKDRKDLITGGMSPAALVAPQQPAAIAPASKSSKAPAASASSSSASSSAASASSSSSSSSAASESSNALAVIPAPNPHQSTPVPSGGAHPPSFLRSIQRRAQKLSRLKRAVKRIQEHTNGSIPLNLKPIEADIEAAADCTEPLNEEDLMIEKLLLKGVGAGIILEGHFNPRADADTVQRELEAQKKLAERNVDLDDDSDIELNDDEINNYLRTDSEVTLLFLSCILLDFLIFPLVRRWKLFNDSTIEL